MDLAAAASFLAGHGRLLDRRRFGLLTGTGTPAGVLAALAAHRNDDGGYGWGLEPDLRDRGSQPAAAMHAFSVIAECGVAAPEATALCDWLQAVAHPDGGLPFALPIADASACAPWWTGADPATSALQMTTQVAAAAHLVARVDDGVRRHPWLGRATAWCIDAAAGVTAEAHAYEVLFTLRFLDAVHDVAPEAPALLAQVAALLPPDGRLAVAGGVPGESLKPLDLPPRVLALLPADVVEADRARLAAGQQPDGGWTVDFASSSPVAELEWRGHATVEAVRSLLGGGPAA